MENIQVYSKEINYLNSTANQFSGSSSKERIFNENELSSVYN
jgi:hypothetical protein